MNQDRHRHREAGIHASRRHSLDAERASAFCDASSPNAAKKMAEVHGNRTPPKNKRKTADSSAGGAKSGALSAVPPALDPALAALMAAWPTLPDAIRAGIRAMIQPWEDKR